VRVVRLPWTRRLALAAAALLLATLFSSGARAADATASGDDTAQLFAAATTELHQGRPTEAIASFEALADRGLVDPVASYDRGLAYAQRVRIGAEVPGDLGRAAHGFEEARALSSDSALVDDATRALTVVRSEVARRRIRAGQPVEVDPGRSLARAVAGLVPEDAWFFVAAAASATFGVGLFVRRVGRGRRLRVGAGVAAGVAVPVLAVSIVMTLASRHDRLYLREAVVVSPGARPSSDQGIAQPGASPLAEGARVELLDSRGGWTRVRFGSLETWLDASTLRPIVRLD
jgi:hypothetical protein